MTDLEPNYEEFTRRRIHSVHNQPLITLQKGGREFTLNRAAHEALGKPAAVVLLYDRDAKIIGFRPSDGSPLHAYPLRRANRAECYHVAGKSFCDYDGIEAETTQRFRAEMRGGVLGISLNQQAAE